MPVAPMTVIETPQERKSQYQPGRAERLAGTGRHAGGIIHGSYAMSGSRIIESMKEAVAIAQGVMPEGTYRVHVPEKVNVKAIRTELGLSQAGFAARFGLSLHTLRNWEQGKRTPDPAARAYLKVIAKAPDVVTGILAE
ncbi:helix-turn-helix domain-containing protein [Desulfovibrio sp. OttesenSCG-928-G11]|nr:helix-turn-helix domain-containing protein [Desulfovibrio sp. OttesenSCG-928-G11]